MALWLDNDNDGIKCQEKLAGDLFNRGKIVFEIPYLADTKDQADKGYLDKTIIKSYELKNKYSFIE